MLRRRPLCWRNSAPLSSARILLRRASARACPFLGRLTLDPDVSAQLPPGGEPLPVWEWTACSPYSFARVAVSEKGHREPARGLQMSEFCRCVLLEQDHLLHGINVKVSFKRHQLWSYPGLFIWDLHWVNLILNYCLLSHQSSGTTHDLIARHLCCLVTTNRE